MRKLRILQAQIMVPDKKEEAIELAESICAKAREEHADIATFPEMFCCPYDNACFPVYAEEEGGRIWQACSDAAAKNGVWLSAGTMPELGADGKIYNTAYVFDREGHQAAKHRKMHLFDVDIEGGQHFHESDTLSPGNEVTVFDTEFGKMGLCVCYDFRFPELGRLMALEGAEAVLVPAAFNLSTGPKHWELMFRAQAMFNQLFTIGTAPARDMSAVYHSWGHSIVTDPWGAVVSHMDEKEGLRLTEIDIDLVSEVREQLPLLKHRRGDIYSLEKR